jgi:NTP pyrophosphatase (non-canonical NTP hydrolase)
MSDDSTTVAELREIVRRFVEERDWNQFHSPKNLSMSVAVEAAELMEHFQWLTTDESRQVAQDPDQLAAIEEEIADVLCYVVALANTLQVDLSESLRRKMIKNASKYPIDQIWGRYGHEDPGGRG